MAPMLMDGDVNPAPLTESSNTRDHSNKSKSTIAMVSTYRLLPCFPLLVRRFVASTSDSDVFTHIAAGSKGSSVFR